MVAPLPPPPGYAPAVVAIALLVWVLTGERGDRQNILNIPSTEKIALRDAEPTGAMGFMEQEEGRKERRMKIDVGADTVQFQGGSIENLSAVSFNLIEKASRTTVFTQKDFTGGKVLVPKRLIEEEKVYLWAIEGRITDGRILEYSGEVFLEKRPTRQ